jgi:uncharacterized protein with ParB-like and HNH nuclease domain
MLRIFLFGLSNRRKQPERYVPFIFNFVQKFTKNLTKRKYKDNIHKKENDMPNENVGNRSFRELFDQTVSFFIPFFQRGYAWEKRQWDALFQDIEEQILNEADDIEDIKKYELFFGSIVVAKMDDSTEKFKKYTVIDGQQRITTVYLLLAMINNIFKKKVSQSQGAVGHINELINLIQNKNVNPGEYLKMKVYSSKGDRLPTYKTVLMMSQKTNSIPISNCTGKVKIISINLKNIVKKN